MMNWRKNNANRYYATSVGCLCLFAGISDLEGSDLGSCPVAHRFGIG